MQLAAQNNIAVEQLRQLELGPLEGHPVSVRLLPIQAQRTAGTLVLEGEARLRHRQPVDVVEDPREEGREGGERGRVGRGSEQSYCILLADDPYTTASERLKTMEKTQDGFEIADVDLKLRGPGEFFGTKQSGLPEFRVANLLRDREILELARSAATRLVESGDADTLDPLVAYIQNRWQRRYGLVQVG